VDVGGDFSGSSGPFFFFPPMTCVLSCINKPVLLYTLPRDPKSDSHVFRHSGKAQNPEPFFGIRWVCCHMVHGPIWAGVYIPSPVNIYALNNYQLEQLSTPTIACFNNCSLVVTYQHQKRPERTILSPWNNSQQLPRSALRRLRFPFHGVDGEKMSCRLIRSVPDVGL
jgi:hypothetical protein